jgi:hypothetical protein
MAAFTWQAKISPSVGRIWCGFWVSSAVATASGICSSFGRAACADGASIHTSKEVKAFLAARPGRVHLERLPAYSPELNPTELVWNQLKQRLKNRVFVSLAELTAAVLEQIGRFEKDPKLIRVFFEKREVAFFTD